MRPSFIDRDDGRIAPAGRAAQLVLAALTGSGDDGPGVLRALGAHGVPAGAVARVVAEARPAAAASREFQAAVAADELRAERLAAVERATREALYGAGADAALLRAVLGRMWSSDVDVLVRASAVERLAAALAGAGLVPLDGVLGRLGRRTPGVVRFAALRGDEVLGALELCCSLYDGGPDAGAAIAAAARGAGDGLAVATAGDQLERRAAKILASRRTTVRAVLELHGLLEVLGETSPRGLAAKAAARAARLERELGLEPALPTARRRLVAPDRRWLAARARSARSLLGQAVRPRRVLVVFSGVDGAGKSTQVDHLAQHLRRLNVPCTTAWVRLGFSGSPLLSGAARAGQRLLPRAAHSAQEARVSGVGDTDPLTRRGLLGWSWALANTLQYVRAARRAARRARGRVLILDRSRLDAAIALDHDYGGALALRLHHAILRHALMRAEHTFYLRLPATVAYARKEDMFAPAVLGGLVERYDRAFPPGGGVTVLDAQRPPLELAAAVLRELASAAP